MCIKNLGFGWCSVTFFGWREPFAEFVEKKYRGGHGLRKNVWKTRFWGPFLQKTPLGTRKTGICITSFTNFHLFSKCWNSSLLLFARTVCSKPNCFTGQFRLCSRYRVPFLNLRPNFKNQEKTTNTVNTSPSKTRTTHLVFTNKLGTSKSCVRCCWLQCSWEPKPNIFSQKFGFDRLETFVCRSNLSLVNSGVEELPSTVFWPHLCNLLKKIARLSVSKQTYKQWSLFRREWLSKNVPSQACALDFVGFW